MWTSRSAATWRAASRRSTRRSLLDIGAYVFTSGIATAEVAAAHIANAYRFANIAVAVRCIGTNKTPIGTYRGAGQPEAAFPMECLVDVLAKEIGMSAADLRARNLVRPQEMPYRVGTSLFGHGLWFTRTPIFRERSRPRRESGYTEQVEIAASGDRVAYGIGCGVETGGLVNFESARVLRRSRRQRGGHVGDVVPGPGPVHDLRAGLRRRRSACRSSAYRCVLAIPTLIPFGRGAFAARGAVIGANAVLGAAQRLRTKVIGHAATLLQCSACDARLENGEIRYGDGRSTDLTIGKIARAVAPGGALFEGEAALEASTVYEAKQLLTSGFSVHVAKIRLDPRTGFFRVEDYRGDARCRTSAQSHDRRRTGCRRCRRRHWRRDVLRNDLRRETGSR